MKAPNQVRERLNSKEDVNVNHLTAAHRPEFKVQFVGGKYDGVYTRDEAIGVVPVVGRTEDMSEMRERGCVVHRKELDCQPIFEGYIGPMWGEDCLWYETPEIYESMSK